MKVLSLAGSKYNRDNFQSSASSKDRGEETLKEKLAHIHEAGDSMGEILATGSK